MQSQVITDVSQLDASRLEALLVSAGALRSGHVAAVEGTSNRSSWSHIARVDVRYSPDAAGACPSALLLKMCHGDGFGPSEYYYYVRDYVDLADAPLPRWYDAQFDPEQQAYHILMEDLGSGYRPTWELAPTEPFGLSVADALARLHAHRWGAERLHAVSASLPGRPEIDRFLGHVLGGLEPLLALAGDALPPARRALLVELCEQAPALMHARAAAAQNLTLVHGDANPGNILAPLDPAGPVYLIDRQPFDWSLTVWTGPSDLAYLMAVSWPTELRRALELPVLRRYHERLRERGIAGYSWDELWADYRLALVQSVLVPVEWCVLEQDRERMRWLWEAQLARTLAAIEDLGCAELWRH